MVKQKFSGSFFCFFVRTTYVLCADSKKVKAEVILNSATLKDSYANYEADAAALGKDLSA